MNKSLIGKMTGLALTTLLFGACSSSPTYKVPDYYETWSVPNQYMVGDVRSLDELRCSERVDGCDRYYRPPVEPDTIKHRKYQKSYLFE